MYNNSTSPVSLNGWSVQYASATGTAWQVTPLSGVIPANGYYLIKEAAGTTGTTDLPTPDATGTINMSGTAGKVALVSSATALSGCPLPEMVKDLVGFGTTVSCFEGLGATPAPSAVNSIHRTPTEFDDNNNKSNFTTGFPSPSNSGVPVATNTVSVSAGTNAAEPSVNGTFTISFSAATNSSYSIIYCTIINLIKTSELHKKILKLIDPAFQSFIQ